MKFKTQVGIVGAGPAGLTLWHLLKQTGIDAVIVEARSREYIENRVRAGVLEQGTVDTLRKVGVAERLNCEGLVHEGIELGFSRRRHRVNFAELLDRKSVTIYGQHEIIKDLVQACIERNGVIHFEAKNVVVRNLEGPNPKISFEDENGEHEISCNYIAGCDGFHGICRPSIPEGIITTYERVYPFAWLGILADAAPALDELLYMNHDRGFALFSMRSPTVTRLYLQCDPAEDIGQWSDDRIWKELMLRLRTEDGWQPTPGRILQKGITGMRSFVVEPMQYGKLFLAGDAAHIVPPTGAKGMNLAIADVRILAEGLSEFYSTGKDTRLRDYSATCVRRVWKVQRFSWWMTSVFHRFHDANPFDHRRQLAELDYVCNSRAAATVLAENYVGLPL